MFGTCYVCLRPCGPLLRLRHWLHPVPPPHPTEPNLMSAPYSRCMGCARLPGPDYWSCGLPARGDRSYWHRHHRWRWSMRLCQWLHGRDARGYRKNGSDGL